MLTEEPSVESDVEFAEIYRAIAAQRFTGTRPAELALSIARVAVMTRMPSPAGGPPPRYRSVEEVLLREGLAFELKSLPLDVTISKRKQCFSNCYERAISSGKYAYCEGVALVEPGFPPISHAWLLDLTDGRAFDPTWRTPGEAYIGVVIDEAYLAAAFPRAGCVIDDVEGRWPILKGAAGNSWRHRWLVDRLAAAGV